MKVFIADDEIYVIEVLKKIVDWQAIGFEIAGTASDGVSAVNMIRESKPDVVITDIRMPGIDGLEMIKSIQQEFPDISFIIISGYKYFKYAQMAIQYGVKGYLLKPINKNELMKLLSQVNQERNLNRQNNFDNNSKEYFEARKKMQGMFLDEIVEKRPMSAETAEQANKDFMLKFRKGVYLCIIFKLDYYFTQNDELFNLNVFENLISLLEELFIVVCYDFIYKVYGSKCVLLANAISCQTINEALSNLQKKINEGDLLPENMVIITCKGSMQNEYKRIPETYDDAVRALKSRILEAKGTRLLEIPKAKNNDACDLNSIFGEDERNDFSKSIEQFDKNEVRSKINLMFTMADSLRIDNADFYWELCEAVYVRFLQTIQYMNLFEDILAEKKRFMNLFEDCVDINAMKRLLIHQILSCIEELSETGSSSENASVIIAKKYITEHYRERITLNHISQLVFLNPVYFSILFKRESGINFVDYVNVYRIEVSKGHLKELKYSLADVADLTGFTNAKYFSKIFKKIVGITPTEYRTKYFIHLNDEK